MMSSRRSVHVLAPVRASSFLLLLPVVLAAACATSGSSPSAQRAPAPQVARKEVRSDQTADQALAQAGQTAQTAPKLKAVVSGYALRTPR